MEGITNLLPDAKKKKKKYTGISHHLYTDFRIKT